MLLSEPVSVECKRFVVVQCAVQCCDRLLTSIDGAGDVSRAEDLLGFVLGNKG